jgi:hypothetical protein
MGKVKSKFNYLVLNKNIAKAPPLPRLISYKERECQSAKSIRKPYKVLPEVINNEEQLKIV